MLHGRARSDVPLLFRIEIVLLSFFFLLASFVSFGFTYGIYPFFPGGSFRFSPDFYYTFYLFFGCATASTILFVYSRNVISSLLLFALATSSMVLLDYSIGDYLTIRAWMYAAFLASFAARVRWPINICACVALAAVFTAAQTLHSFLGENTLNPGVEGPSPRTLFPFAVILLVVGTGVPAIKNLSVRLERAKRRIEELNGTITKLTEFNQTLQNYARTVDEVATKKERFRISREIHDISGYIFTNIIALMDAIIITGCQSPEKSSEICLTARVQAQEGLQETRKALRALRTIDDRRETGLRAIYKIKKIFEDTTGVEVKIEAGNMPATFGDEIDRVVYRTVQEALTNALRHGRATKIAIDFSIRDGFFHMSVLDNGSGAKKLTKGIGLAGMEERISQLGGVVVASNAEEGGFRLSVRIPYSTGRNHD